MRTRPRVFVVSVRRELMDWLVHSGWRGVTRHAVPHRMHGVLADGKTEADPGATRSVGEPDAPAVRGDDGVRDGEAEAAAVVAARRARVALEEGLEHAIAVVVGDPLARVGDLDLDALSGALRADGDASVGRGVADRVLDEVEEDALKLLGIAAGDEERIRHRGLERHAARLPVGAHGLDGLEDQLVERDALHRPPDVAGLQARELEEV